MPTSKKSGEKYLEQTRNHEQIVSEVMSTAYCLKYRTRRSNSFSESRVCFNSGVSLSDLRMLGINPVRESWMRKLRFDERARNAG
jgi:hypothetical protein